jgi:thioredoxin 1
MHASSLTVFLGCCFLILSCTTTEKKVSNNTTPENINESLSPQEFKSKLESTPDAVVVDVRTPEEMSSGVIDGAINVDFKDSSFTEKINSLDKDKPYFVYCLSGKRSGSASELMEEAGFKEVYTLKDGLQRWTQEGLNTTKP